MTKQHFLNFLTFTIITVLISSCVKDNCTREITYTKYTPIFMTEAEMLQDAEFISTQTLKEPGKIYFYNNYIFINELRKGIHIIDNTNPSTPQNLGFIAIKGNIDMAVKNNILYADNYTSLLAIDITDPLAPVQLNRELNVFPTLSNQGDGTFLVYYETEEVTEVVACNSSNGWGRSFQNDLSSPTAYSGGGGQSAPVGVGGSMARFTIVDDYLYTVDNSNLHVFDISTGSSTNKISTSSVGWNIETIFPNDNKLFLGSANGMYIYDITNRISPSFLSEFSHVGACDPVFVKGDLAYVTLRSGTVCDGFNNQMEVVDISDPTQPNLLKIYEMENPHGLSIAGNTMFLCEGENGLKVLDIENHMDINELKHYTDFSTYDVISLPNNLLLVIGADGFYQYDYSDVNNLQQLSKIEVNQ